jgi:hypothetical protein
MPLALARAVGVEETTQNLIKTALALSIIERNTVVCHLCTSLKPHIKLQLESIRAYLQPSKPMFLLTEFNLKSFLEPEIPM